MPLGKKLGVKCRSQGKYDMIVKIGKALVSNEYVSIDEGSNFRCLKCKQVNVIKTLPEASKWKEKSSASLSNASSPSASKSGGDTLILNESSNSESETEIPLS